MGLARSTRKGSIPFGDRVALIENPGDFARLPDARQDQVETTAGVSSAPTARGR
jgi:hypothetical protein